MKVTYTAVCSLVAAAVEIAPDEEARDRIRKADAHARHHQFSEVDRLKHVVYYLYYGVCGDWHYEEEEMA